MISQRGQMLKPSPTLAMADRARELIKAGKDVISLTVGEPDWPTLRSANQGALQAIEKGFTKYTPAHGIPELRRALRPWIKEETGIEYSESEIVVGSGAKFVIAALFQMTLNPGDEVLIPSPYWVSYPVMAELAGGVPKIIRCGPESRFKLTPDLLAKNISSRTKVLVLCSPSNPTGIAYTAAELKALAEIVRKHPHLLVVSDDIYNRLMFGDEPIAAHLLKAAPDLRNQVVCVNGASKAFAMTGWRVGWAAGPLALMKVMADFFSQTTSNPCSVSQYAVLAAIENGKEELAVAVQNLKTRLSSNGAALRTVPGVKVIEPDGAFYFWLDVHGWLQKKHLPSGKVVTNSADISNLLLDHQNVATVPGIEFGSEGYLRLSFAINPERFLSAVQRLKDFASFLG